MALPEENLDDVIASLVDSEPGEDTGSDNPPAGPETEIDADSVSLTERAARQIRRIREQENLEEALFLRVAVEGGGCSGLSYKLGFDVKTGEDEMLQSHGIDIVVSPKHMMYLEGIVIDYPDGLDARGFTFDNPNASESCGCGSSFAV